MEPKPTTNPEPAPAQSNRTERFSLSTYLVSFAAAIILYALSPGPIAKCWHAGTASLSTARVAAIAYAPIVFCCQRFPVVARFYNWYMKDIWGLP